MRCHPRLVLTIQGGRRSITDEKDVSLCQQDYVGGALRLAQCAKHLKESYGISSLKSSAYPADQWALGKESRKYWEESESSPSSGSGSGSESEAPQCFWEMEWEGDLPEDKSLWESVKRDLQDMFQDKFLDKGETLTIKLFPGSIGCRIISSVSVFEKARQMRQEQGGRLRIGKFTEVDGGRGPVCIALVLSVGINADKVEGAKQWVCGSRDQHKPGFEGLGGGCTVQAQVFEDGEVAVWQCDLISSQAKEERLVAAAEVAAAAESESAATAEELDAKEENRKREAEFIANLVRKWLYSLSARRSTAAALLCA
jgi:hypothetical protein